jgi:hypothetical protein
MGGTWGFFGANKREIYNMLAKKTVKCSTYFLELK